MNIRKRLCARSARKTTAGPGYRRPGQALLELTLSISFIALLFAAAIDLGLAFKAYQTLLNATAEASSYLSLYPVVNCEAGLHVCPDEDPTPRGGADLEARNRFRTEQGGTLRGSSSTLDLDATGRDDASEHGWTWIANRVLIQEADSSQVTVSNSNFAVNGTFNGTSDTNCRERYKFDRAGGQCFIVVRTEILYHPFMLSPAIGPTLTIRAISVRPIVGGQG